MSKRQQIREILSEEGVLRGVFCLLAALQFHDLTTQLPSEVYLAIERGKRTPKIDWPPINVFHISESQFGAGIEEHEIESGPTLRVYSPARTVADCFKFRNQDGLDVAIEALREGWRCKRFTMDEVYGHAKVCRVQRVMRPYLEMLQ